MATPNLSEIAATTIENRSRQIADNVSKNNALLARLMSRGRVKNFTGGEDIVQELNYQENGTFTRYAGYELLDVSPQEVLTAARYGIKQAAVAVTISGLEQIQNAGRERMINLLSARIETAEATMKNNISADIYSDGTADGGKQITGLGAVISTTPATGTVGGINRADWPFWRNLHATADYDNADAAAAQKALRAAWEKMYLDLCRGSDKPDMIVCDTNVYSLFSNSLQLQQRYTRNSDVGKAGFENLAFHAADVVLDGGKGGSAPTNTAIFLNTDYLFLRPVAGRNMTPLDSGRYSVNQDAMVQLIAWAGNLATSNAGLQGKVTNA